MWHVAVPDLGLRVYWYMHCMESMSGSSSSSKFISFKWQANTCSNQDTAGIPEQINHSWPFMWMCVEARQFRDEVLACSKSLNLASLLPKQPAPSCSTTKGAIGKPNISMKHPSCASNMLKYKIKRWHAILIQSTQ
jgi:hypothetical protein